VASGIGKSGVDVHCYTTFLRDVPHGNVIEPTCRLLQGLAPHLFRDDAGTYCSKVASPAQR
jgi:hypothetical protein